jgi:predicted RNA-binding protein with RPS1 domain
MNLIDNIKILKHNSDYRVSDIVYKLGERWTHSGDMVLKNEKYEKTILHKYLKINGLNNKPNLDILLKIIEKYNSHHNLPIPQNNEIVIHLRLGDVVVHDWFLSKNYIELINNILKKNNNINKITFVTCFAYQEWSKESLHLRKQAPLWEYTEEKQNKNIQKINILFNNILRLFPNMEINIYSNDDIDKDMCYCVLSKNFIHDNGGFSNLLLKLNNLKNGKGNVKRCN